MRSSLLGVAHALLHARPMLLFFAILLTVHGLIHLLGFAKAFELAALPQLAEPIARGVGVIWLFAALAMLAAAAVLLVGPRWFWVVGGCALMVSQLLIVSAWSDAKVGTLANVVLLFGVIVRFASHGPPSLRREYTTAAKAQLREPRAADVVRAEDLLALPASVQKYLQSAGVVGRPRVSNLRATWKGRIREGATDPWMAFTAEQTNFFGAPSARFFLMSATMHHVPVDVLHRFVGPSATFRVRLLSLLTVVDARGPAMDRAETVTIFNDMCVLAPSTLLDPSVTWEGGATERSATARFTRGSESISARLVFDEAGELVDFVSNDRLAASADGTSFEARQWQTPVHDYRDVAGRRVMSRAETRWSTNDGSYTYGEFELVDVEYDVDRIREPE